MRKQRDAKTTRVTLRSCVMLLSETVFYNVSLFAALRRSDKIAREKYIFATTLAFEVHPNYVVLKLIVRIIRYKLDETRLTLLKHNIKLQDRSTREKWSRDAKLLRK